jgi:Ribbon-helix-helix protein, copG family
MVVKRALSIYLQPDLIERIEAAAEADDRSISNYIERALDSVTPRVRGERVIVASNIPDERPGGRPKQKGSRKAPSR